MVFITIVSEEGDEVAVKMKMCKSLPQSEGDYCDWHNIEPNQLMLWVNQELGLQKHTTLYPCTFCMNFILFNRIFELRSYVLMHVNPSNYTAFKLNSQSFDWAKYSTLMLDLLMVK